TWPPALRVTFPLRPDRGAHRTLEDVVRVVSAVVVSLALAGVAVASAATAVPSAPIHVTPAAGGPRTGFSGRATGGGPGARFTAAPPAADRASLGGVRPPPPPHAGRWCVGTYRGQ